MSRTSDLLNGKDDKHQDKTLGAGATTGDRGLTFTKAVEPPKKTDVANATPDPKPNPIQSAPAPGVLSRTEPPLNPAEKTKVSPSPSRHPKLSLAAFTTQPERPTINLAFAVQQARMKQHEQEEANKPYLQAAVDGLTNGVSRFGEGLWDVFARDPDEAGPNYNAHSNALVNLFKHNVRMVRFLGNVGEDGLNKVTGGRVASNTGTVDGIVTDVKDGWTKFQNGTPSQKIQMFFDTGSNFGLNAALLSVGGESAVIASRSANSLKGVIGVQRDLAAATREMKLAVKVAPVPVKTAGSFSLRTMTARQVSERFRQVSKNVGSWLERNLLPGPTRELAPAGVPTGFGRTAASRDVGLQFRTAVSTEGKVAQRAGSWKNWRDFLGGGSEDASAAVKKPVKFVPSKESVGTGSVTEVKPAGEVVSDPGAQPVKVEPPNAKIAPPKAKVELPEGRVELPKGQVEPPKGQVEPPKGQVEPKGQGKPFQAKPNSGHVVPDNRPVVKTGPDVLVKHALVADGSAAEKAIVEALKGKGDIASGAEALRTAHPETASRIAQTETKGVADAVARMEATEAGMGVEFIRGLQPEARAMVVAQMDERTAASIMTKLQPQEAADILKSIKEPHALQLLANVAKGEPEAAGKIAGALETNKPGMLSNFVKLAETNTDAAANLATILKSDTKLAASVIENVKPDTASKVLNLLDAKAAGQVFENVKLDTAAEVMKALGVTKAGHVLANMESGAAAKVLANTETKTAVQVLANMAETDARGVEAAAGIAKALESSKPGTFSSYIQLAKTDPQVMTNLAKALKSEPEFAAAVLEKAAATEPNTVAQVVQAMEKVEAGAGSRVLAKMESGWAAKVLANTENKTAVQMLANLAERDAKAATEMAKALDASEPTRLSSYVKLAETDKGVATNLATVLKNDPQFAARVLQEAAVAEPQAAARFIQAMEKVEAGAGGRVIANMEINAAARILANTEERAAVQLMAGAAETDAQATAGIARALETNRPGTFSNYIRLAENKPEVASNVARVLKTDTEFAITVLKEAEPKAAAGVLTEMAKTEPKTAARIVADLAETKPNLAANVVREVANNDLAAAADIIKEVPPARATSILAKVAETEPRAAATIVEQVAKSEPRLAANLLKDVAKAEPRIIEADPVIAVRVLKADPDAAAETLTNLANTDINTAATVLGIIEKTQAPSENTAAGIMAKLEKSVADGITRARGTETVQAAITRGVEIEQAAVRSAAELEKAAAQRAAQLEKITAQVAAEGTENIARPASRLAEDLLDPKKNPTPTAVERQIAADMQEIERLGKTLGTTGEDAKTIANINERLKNVSKTLAGPGVRDARAVEEALNVIKPAAGRAEYAAIEANRLAAYERLAVTAEREAQNISRIAETLIKPNGPGALAKGDRLLNEELKAIVNTADKLPAAENPAVETARLRQMVETLKDLEVRAQFEQALKNLETTTQEMTRLRTLGNQGERIESIATQLRGELPAAVRDLPASIRELPATVRELPASVRELPATVRATTGTADARTIGRILTDIETKGESTASIDKDITALKEAAANIPEATKLANSQAIENLNNAIKQLDAANLARTYDIAMQTGQAAAATALQQQMITTTLAQVQDGLGALNSLRGVARLPAINALTSNLQLLRSLSGSNSEFLGYIQSAEAALARLGLRSALSGDGLAYAGMSDRRLLNLAEAGDAAARRALLARQLTAPGSTLAALGRAMISREGWPYTAELAFGGALALGSFLIATPTVFQATVINPILRAKLDAVTNQLQTLDAGAAQELNKAADPDAGVVPGGTTSDALRIGTPSDRFTFSTGATDITTGNTSRTSTLPVTLTPSAQQAALKAYSPNAQVLGQSALFSPLITASVQPFSTQSTLVGNLLTRNSFWGPDADKHGAFFQNWGTPWGPYALGYDPTPQAETVAPVLQIARTVKFKGGTGIGITGEPPKFKPATTAFTFTRAVFMPNSDKVLSYTQGKDLALRKGQRGAGSQGTGTTTTSTQLSLNLRAMMAHGFRSDGAHHVIGYDPHSEQVETGNLDADYGNAPQTSTTAFISPLIAPSGLTAQQTATTPVTVAASQAKAHLPTTYESPRDKVIV